MIRVGSLFSGIGGLDLGLERAGMQVVWQSEIDRFALAILERHWPAVQRLGSVQELLGRIVNGDCDAPDLVTGGDPCPCRSTARIGRATVHPDLSGWFLAVVGRLRPRWVVRENVPASDCADFAAALELLGYRPVVVGLCASSWTAQRRRREIVVGCARADAADRFATLVESPGGAGDDRPMHQEARALAPCLVAHRFRGETSDCFVFEESRGRIRILSAEEREALQGFPTGWTAGLSESRRDRLIGNAVPPPMAEWIGRRIIEADT